MESTINGSAGASTGAAPTVTTGTPVPQAAPQSTSTSGTTVTQPATTGATEGANGATNSGTYTITVDGKPTQVSLDDLIVRAQKGTAAEKRFEEAARIRKEAEIHIQAVNELKDIINKKDYNRFKEVIGEDFFTGLSGNGQPVGRPNYSIEDIRTAEVLGVDVDAYVDAKKRALGIDNPMVARQAQEISELKSQLAKVNEYVHSAKIEFDAAKIETQFRTVAEKYPDVDPNRVLDIVEREKRSASDFENIFKALDEVEKRKLEERYNKYAEDKKKASMGSFGGVNYSNEQPNKEQFKGKTLDERRRLLKEMFK